MDHEILPTGSWTFEDASQYHFDRSLAQSLAVFFRGQTVLDLGCGAGFYTRQIGPNCRGYDGNPNTPQLTEGRCGVLDLATPFHATPADWVLCLEVAEHVPKEFEHIFIDNLHCHNTKGIVLSWARKNQGGRGHVNEQDPEYVDQAFAALQYCRFVPAENLLREASTLSWFRKNIMVFLKRSWSSKFSP